MVAKSVELEEGSGQRQLGIRRRADPAEVFNNN